jgi:hypothetical protein
MSILNFSQFQFSFLIEYVFLFRFCKLRIINEEAIKINSETETRSGGSLESIIELSVASDNQLKNFYLFSSDTFIFCFLGWVFQIMLTLKPNLHFKVKIGSNAMRQL